MPKKLRQEMQALLIELEALRELERTAEERRQRVLLAKAELQERIQEAKRIQEMVLANRGRWSSQEQHLNDRGTSRCKPH